MASSPNYPSSPGKRYDVIVRGAGIVGQTLALLLARERLKVALVSPQRPGSDQPDVRAYALNLASRELLESVRGWPVSNDARATVTPVTSMDVHGDDGGQLVFDAPAAGQAPLNWIVEVPALESRLADAVHFQGGIDCLPDAPAKAALTVICEGRRSATRESVGIEYDVRPYPHKAIAGRLQCELGHGGVARQWFSNGEIMALLPLDGEQGNSVALVWSLEKAKADAWLAAEPENLAQAVQDRCHSVLGAMHLSAPAQAWPLELSRARRWVMTRPDGTGIALAGDAAHAMHPLAGQGLNVGLADVAELAKVIHEREFWRPLGDMRLLRRYERARQADVNAMSWLTDGLFGLFDRQDERVQMIRNWGMSGVNHLSPLKSWLTRQAMGRSI